MSDVIGECCHWVAALDVAGSGTGELEATLAGVRRLQRCLDGLVVRIGVRSNQLAATGRAAPAVEMARGAGTVGLRQARREAGRAELAAASPPVGEALSVGALSGEHADALGRHLHRLTDKQRSVFPVGELIGRSELPVETFDRLVKRRVDAIIGDHGVASVEAKRAASEFRHWFDREAGMGRFTGSLDPERYEMLSNAVEQHVSSIAATSGDRVEKGANLAARAVVELLTSSARDTRGRLPSITVIVDHKTAHSGPHDASICQTGSGHDLAFRSLDRLCCDAVIRRVTLDAVGVPINVGRKHRTATDAQWAALKVMYSSCAWAACSVPINWCQAHHIREWDRAGPTDFNNLLPLCTQHHHRVHEGRWRVSLQPDRSLTIHRPDGTTHTTIPPPQRC